MPELPEVETIVRGLQKPLLGRTITDARILWANTLRQPIDDFQRRIALRRIDALTRRGKFLQFQLSGGETLFVHLKMSGSFSVMPNIEPLHKHIRAVFQLDNGHQLRFKDMRKFGRIILTDDPNSVIGHLGPEPLADTFTADDFIALFAHRRGTLKPLLMNQNFMAGIGNIYASEACFWAKVNPHATVDTLSTNDLTRLYHAIQKVLRHGITAKGASLDAVYRGGDFQNYFQVYGKSGEPCSRCGAPIQRTVLAQRSTFFCPNCQGKSNDTELPL